jgi:hypothetical protein
MECDYNPTLNPSEPNVQIEILSKSRFNELWPSIHHLTKNKESIEGINPILREECEDWASRHQLRVAVVANAVVGTFRRVHTGKYGLTVANREDIEEVLNTVKSCRIGTSKLGKEPEDYQIFDWKDGKISRGRQREKLKIEIGSDLFGFGKPNR